MTDQQHPNPNPGSPARALYSDASGLQRLGASAWRATGGSGGQVIFVERAKDLVVLNATASMDKGAEVRAIIRLKTAKPIGVLVYGSGAISAHGGAVGLVGDDRPQVIGADPILYDEARDTLAGDAPTPGLHRVRALRRARVKGLSLGQNPERSAGRGFLPVTTPLAHGTINLSERDISLEVRRTPALRGDQLSLWLPEDRVLVGERLTCATQSFAECLLQGPVPDFAQWLRTLNAILALNPRMMASVSEDTLQGERAVALVLRDHIAALHAVVDQVAEGLGRGLTPQELEHLVRLPDDLQEAPHLAPIAQTLGWITRAYAVQALGWFDGNPTTLARLSPRDEARRFIRLAGGSDVIFQEAETTEEPQWGLELCDRLILAGAMVEEARSLKSACLHILSEQERDPVRRRYYLACAREIEL